MTFVLVFLAGLLYEALYLGWITVAGRGLAKTAALLSAMVGAVSFYGFSAGMHDARTLPALLLGYACGSYLVVRLTDKPKRANYSG